MNEDKQNHRQDERLSKLKQLTKKRWFYPAVYLSVAALVIATVLWTQLSSNVATEKNEETALKEQEAIPVAQQQEVFVRPALTQDAKIITPFYQSDASAEKQESALVFYNNKYHQHKGIDFALDSGEPFDVVAALSGTVEKAEKDALLGYVVELKHGNGVKTIYQSLTNMNVKEGDKVEQGDLIGEAGQNVFNKKAGTHVHFEIRKDNIPLNPEEYIGKTIADIPAKEELEAQREKQEATEESADDDNAAKPKDATRSMANT